MTLKVRILPFLTTFTQLTARLKNFLRGWLLVLSLKEGLVECATVCVKSEHLLNKTYLYEFQVHKNHPISVLISLPPEHTLNADAPNSWKLESKSQGLVKGQVPETLKFDINVQSDDFFTIILKLYLCSNGMCTVRSTKIVFQTDENARDTGDNEIQIKV